MADLFRAKQGHNRLVLELRAAFPTADDETIADTAAGESDLDTAIAAVLREAIEADATAEALKGVMRKQAERCQRLKARGDRLRAIALYAAEAANMRTIRGPHIPDLSAAIMHSNRGVIILNEGQLPDAYVEVKRIPKKGDIGDALRAGETVPGAALGNSHSYWVIRRG